jgi:hypothetical protein
MRRVVPHDGSTTHVSVVNHNHFAISGAQDPRGVARQVIAAFDDMTKSPRSVLARSALYRTHASLPLPLTMNPAGTIA